jgi:hypothetical protein
MLHRLDTAAGAGGTRIGVAEIVQVDTENRGVGAHAADG